LAKGGPPSGPPPGLLWEVTAIPRRNRAKQKNKSSLTIPRSCSERVTAVESPAMVEASVLSDFVHEQAEEILLEPQAKQSKGELLWLESKKAG
jgi:hypothetical protein